MTSTIPLVSIIIRTKNEERWIGHTIQSVLDHITSPEIIIIDNNSSDETIDIVNNFKLICITFLFFLITKYAFLFKINFFKIPSLSSLKIIISSDFGD